MDVPVPETSKDTDTITLSRVTDSSSGRKIVMVIPRNDFCFYFEESEVVRPEQESGEPTSAELVISK